MKYGIFAFVGIIAMIIPIISCSGAIDIESRLDEAHELMEGYYYQPAIEICDNIIKRDPDVARAYEIRGDVYTRQKEDQKALADYTSAIRIDPHNPVLFAKRGDIYRKTAEYRHAESDYSKTLDLGLETPDVYLGRGISLCETGQYEASIDNLNTYFSFELDEKDTLSYRFKAYLSRGKAYYEIGMFDKAIDDLTSAMEIDSRVAEVYFIRGKAFSALDRTDDAIDDFSLGLNLDNTDPEIFMKRALLYYDKGEFYLSNRDANAALSLNPDHRHAKDLAAITAKFLNTMNRE